MSDLHTHKVMQEGDADGKYPRPAPHVEKVNPWLVAAVAIVVIVIVGAILFPVLTKVKNGHGRNRSLSNLMQLSLASLMYSFDYDEHLPPAEKWMDVIEPYHKNTQVPHDPSIKDRKDDEYGFAFFEPVSGIDTRTVVDQDAAPMLFQSVLMGRNAYSDLSTLPTIPRLNDTNYVAFVSGHARGFPSTWPEHPITVVLDPSLAKEPGN